MENNQNVLSQGLENLFIKTTDAIESTLGVINGSPLIASVQKEAKDELMVCSHTANILFAEKKEGDLGEILLYVGRINDMVMERIKKYPPTVVLE